MDSKGRIGLIIPHMLYNLDVSLVDIIHKTAAINGYDTIVITAAVNYVNFMLSDPYNKGQTNIYDLIVMGDFDGFIFDANIFCSEKQRRSILELLRRANKPCVVINYEQPYFPSVTSDESVHLRIATEHLIREHGCRVLYCVGGYKGEKLSEERISGFREAMENAGLPYDESCIFYGDYWRDIPRKIALDIAEGRLEAPDGIVCGSDIMAIEMCRTFRENGVRVPEDIKVTGCDGNTSTQIEYVSVTTVSGMERINGQLAVNKLMKLLGNDIDESKNLSPELVIGESCGCADCVGLKRSRAVSEMREYAGKLFEMYESRRTFSLGDMLNRMTACHELNDFLGVFIGCHYMIPTAITAELCLGSDWRRDMENPSVYRRGGLPDTMQLCAESGRENAPQIHGEFPTADILPSLNVPHKPRLSVITSIHFMEQIFGYVSFTYKKAVDIILDEFYISWCDTIGNGLNSLQNRMYKDHINRRIESLSEHAPVLGIYNKRGLINKLMNVMLENDGKSYAITLMTYVKDDRMKYVIPPVNAIVNALKLSGDELILGSVDENIIAIVDSSDGFVGPSFDFAEEIAEKVSDAYKGAVKISSDRLVAINKKVKPDNIYEIDDLIDDAANEINGKLMTMRSGVVSYRDSFEALRKTIFNEPQRDWNIENITRSLGLSKSHFQRIYKELFGTSCKEDIIISRIERAKWLLENTDLSVSDVSEKCGHMNMSHFIRQFGQRTGSSPAEYRKRTKTCRT